MPSFRLFLGFRIVEVCRHHTIWWVGVSEREEQDSPVGNEKDDGAQVSEIKAGTRKMDLTIYDLRIQILG